MNSPCNWIIHNHKENREEGGCDWSRTWGKGGIDLIICCRRKEKGVALSDCEKEKGGAIFGTCNW